MKTKHAIQLLVFALLGCTLSACSDRDDRLDSLEPSFSDITRDMTMEQVNALVGKPDGSQPLEDSGGGIMSTWGENTRVMYDRNKKVTAVIHNGVALTLE